MFATGSFLLTFAGICQDLRMFNFVRTWKMTCGSKKRASARSSVIVFLFYVVVPVTKYCLILLLAVHLAAVVSHSGRRMNSGADFRLPQRKQRSPPALRSLKSERRQNRPCVLPRTCDRGQSLPKIRCLTERVERKKEKIQNTAKSIIS